MVQAGDDLGIKFMLESMSHDAQIINTDKHIRIVTPSNPNFFFGNYTFFKGAVSEDAAFYVEEAKAHFPNLGHCLLMFEQDASHLLDDFRAMGFEIETTNLHKFEGNADFDMPSGYDLRVIGEDELPEFEIAQQEGFGYADSDYLTKRIAAESRDDRFTHMGFYKGNHILGSLVLIQTSFGIVIENVAVRKALHGQGLGTAMLKAVIAANSLQGQDIYIGAEAGGRPEKLCIQEQVSMIKTPEA